MKMTSHSPKLRPLVDQLLALPIYNNPKGKTPINYFSIYSKCQIRLSTHYLLQHSSASLSCNPNYSDEAGNDQPLSLIQFQRRKNFIVNPVVSKCSLNQQLKQINYRMIIIKLYFFFFLIECCEIAFCLSKKMNK